MTDEFAHDAMALDRASVRTMDADGHMHISRTPISKANVCPYLGREIPDWQGLGLDPAKTYKLFRHPDELEKAAKSFSGKPLLVGHKPVSAEDHDHQKTVGSVTSAEFEAPYLYAALDVWSGPAIEGINSNKQRELSSAYRYTADMTPGTYQGERYDGVMRNIKGNHVALVKDGRAGPDVVVGDSALLSSLETSDMATKPAVLTRKATVAHGAMIAYLMPKLAQDAKVDLTPLFAKVDAKNYKASKPAIAAGVKKATEGKLAKDASIDDVVELLDKLEAIEPAEVIEAAIADPNGLGPEPEAKDDVDPDAGGDGDAKAFLASKGLSPEEIAKVISMLSGPPTSAGMDNSALIENGKKKVAKDAVVAKDAEKKDMITKPAMDAAIAAAVAANSASLVKAQKDLRDAERFVRPWVGDIVAQDSAEDVYRTALTSLNVEIDPDVPPAAYKAILKAQPIPGANKSKSPVVAQDAATAKGFAERYPAAGRIRTL